MADIQIGKIKSIRFGSGGYQDACIGVTVELGSKSWGVQDFKGAWAIKRSEYCQWTEEDRVKQLGEMVLWVRDRLAEAHVDDLKDLEGKPVEVTFEGNCLKSWRLLTEAL